MSLLQKIFGKRNHTQEVAKIETPTLDINLLNKVSVGQDRRLTALVEQMQVIPPGIAKGFFPNTIESTNYYQSIIKEFEEIQEKLPENKGLFIIDGSLSTFNEDAFQFHHKPILLSHKMQVAPQIKEFLNPNWHIREINIIKDDLDYIENNVDISEAYGFAYFGSGKEYKPLKSAKRKIINVNPTGLKEKMLQMYSLMRVGYLQEQGMKPYLDTEEFKDKLRRELESQYQGNGEFIHGLSSYDLVNENDETIIEKKDTYYEGKNIFILYDILDNIKNF